MRTPIARASGLGLAERDDEDEHAHQMKQATGDHKQHDRPSSIRQQRDAAQPEPLGAHM